MKEFPDFDFQLSPAFLHAIHDVRLYARTVHLYQVIEEVFRLAIGRMEFSARLVLSSKSGASVLQNGFNPVE